MDLPKFLLADNIEFPEDIFVLHTEYPRFLLNLKDDSIEWFDDISDEDEQELANEMELLIQSAEKFYDKQMEDL